jgi:riboflavin kinase / FMN adenylyltransferase
MKVLNSLGHPPDADVALTIGSFDGVHRGHQHLVSQLLARARATGRLGAALTFDPHPRTVLRPDWKTRYLTTLDQKRDLLAELGLDLLVILKFTRDLAALSAESFARLLYDRLNMRELLIGPDFRMGRDRQGTNERLAIAAGQIGFGLQVVEPLLHEGQPISSTRIRTLLGEGRVADAAQLLGRPVTLSGEVVQGARRGRRLGFPTANIPLDPVLATPADGVYAVWARFGDQCCAAVANVGTSPSFGSSTRLLEVYVLDYAGELYGMPMTVEFVHRLRPVLRYESVDALVAQIALDVGATRTTLGVSGSGTCTTVDMGPDQRRPCVPFEPSATRTSEGAGDGAV